MRSVSSSIPCPPAQRTALGDPALTSRPSAARRRIVRRLGLDARQVASASTLSDPERMFDTAFPAFPSESQEAVSCQPESAVSR